MPNLKVIEILLILFVLSGLFAGIFLTIRLTRRSVPPTEGN